MESSSSSVNNNCALQQQQQQQQQRNNTHNANLAYIYAQKMNNNAALCVEIGQYDRAISSLSKALRLSRIHIEKQDSILEVHNVCGCYHCSLDGCIAFSEHNNNNNHHHHRALLNLNPTATDNDATIVHQHKRARLQGPTIEINNNEQGYPLSSHYCHSTGHNALIKDDEGSSNGGITSSSFVHRQLIRVPDHGHGHNIGLSLLSLITIFNLALVCHLRAINNNNDTNNNDKSTATSTSAATNINNNSTIEKTIKLYEVAYNALKKYTKDNDAMNTNANNNMNETSIQFKMILCNNLSHIHKLTGNHFRHTHYLQELLSTIMCVIDYKLSPLRNGNNTNYGNDDDNSNSNNNNNNKRQQQQQQRFIDLGGFLTNVAPLIFIAASNGGNAQCADAA